MARKKKTVQQLGMFPGGEDLPLMTGAVMAAPEDHGQPWQPPAQDALFQWACGLCKDTGKVWVNGRLMTCWCQLAKKEVLGA